MTCLFHIWNVNVSFICVTWLIHMCDIAHSYVWHNSFISVIRLTDVWHDAFVSVTWSVSRHALSRLQIPPLLIHMYDMTVLQCMHMGDMAHWYVWPYSFISVTWPMNFMCDMTHVLSIWRHVLSTLVFAALWCAPLWCMVCPFKATWLCHNTFICVTLLIHVCGMTHS